LSPQPETDTIDAWDAPARQRPSPQAGSHRLALRQPGTVAALRRDRFGSPSLRRAIEEPLRQIAENAGVEGSIVVDQVKEREADFGYNAATDDYGNLLAMGVIDPVKVVRTALENAASIAGLMLTTECLIAERQKSESTSAQA
jgi:chaperonin GroEL